MTNFVLRSVFEELTEYTVAQSLSPIEAYVVYAGMIEVRRISPDTYGSTAVTSGGHSRIHHNNIDLVIAKNTQTCREMAGALVKHGQLDPARTILPVDLGYIAHWRQSDYLAFWNCVITQPKISSERKLRRFEGAFLREQDKAGVDLEIFNSGRSHQERAPEYFKHSAAFVHAARKLGCEPLKRMVRLVDPDKSLGGQTERSTARQLGIPVYTVVAVRPLSDVNSALPSRQLIRDREKIIRYGGHMIAAASGSMLVLQQETTSTYQTVGATN